MQEIERKFLIDELPENLEEYKKVQIEQGYLTVSGNPTVRIRKYNDDYILCYKFREQEKNNDSIASICREEELPLTIETYEHLKQKVDGKVITKTRYIIPLENDLKAEVDIFHGYLNGLKVVEVEFKNKQEANDFVPPRWFGKDVSLDKRYKNALLTQLNDVTELLKIGE